MNKYVLLMILVFIFLVMILISNSILLSTPIGQELLGGVGISEEYTSVSIRTMMKSMFLLATFQIPSMPVVMNILMFYPVTFGIIYMIIDVVKDLIPFT